MIKVNLVPPEILAKAKQRQIVLQAAFIGGIVLVVLASISFGHWYGKHSLEQTLAYDEAELRRLDAIVKQVEELERAAAAVRARLNVIENLLLGRAYYPVFMSEFARSVPPGIKINSLATAGQSVGVIKLTINAVANSSEDIVTWMKTLEKNAKFGMPELGSVSALAETYTFALTATYTSK